MAASLRSFCCKRSIHLDIVHNKRIWNKLRFFCASNKVNSVRVRFAPSPTGWLHLGGLRTALYNYLFAKSRNGSFLLRIEDTDRSRFVPATTDHIQEILDWAGIIPDEGPDQGGDHGPYMQSERLQMYNDNIKTLLDNGWAYPCFCTSRRLELMRKEATRRGEASKYDNRCRHLSPEQMQEFLDKNTPFVIRLKLEPTPEPWNDLIKGEVSHDIYGIEGDPVLLKSDGYPTYHFANVVDDHFMGITHVLRGSEWISSTPKHILLYKAFGWTPPSFGHLPLIVNPDGTKLSKRQGDVNVQQIRDSDHFPESLLSYVTSIGGGFAGSTQGMSLKDMCQSFDISSVRKHTGRLDPTRLKEAAIANLHTKAHSDDPEVIKSLTDRLQGHINGAYKDSLSGGPLQEQVTNQDYLIDVIRWGLKDQRVTVLRDFLQPDLSCLWRTPSKSQVLELVTMETEAQSILKRCLQWIKDGEFDGDDLPLEELSAGLKSVMAQEKIKPKRFFQFLRKALTGDVQGPPVAEMISVLGKRNVILRLETALELVGQEQTA